MGKVEDMRRLREQRAEESRRAAAGAGTPPASTAPAAARAQAAPAPAPAAAGTTPGVCGHTSISGRSCTREEGHQKTGTKNHRYG